MANEYLKRTPTSTGNRKIFTYAGWFKKNNGNGSDRFDIFNAYNTGSQEEEIGFRQDALRYLSSGSSLYGFDTTNKYRDTGNWFHIVFALNTTLESERKRSVIYINGVEVDTTTSSGIGAYVAKNFDSIAFNVADKEHNVLARKYSSSGRDYVEGGGFDIFFVDGQALTPDVFGFFKDGKGYQSSGTSQATDFRPGQWSPHSPRKIKTEIERRGGFGVNGFYLPMNDSSNPGADFHCDPNSIIKLKGEDLPQPRNGAPTTSDAYVSELRPETGSLGFDGVVAFDGSGDYLSIPSSSDFALGTGDWTIEYFAYPTSTAQYQRHFYLIGSSANNIEGIFADGNGISFGKTNVWAPSQVSHPLYRWNHYALVHDSTNMRLYINGNQVITSTDNFANENKSLHIGYSNSTFGGYFTGFMSNFRVVKGTALYTSNFTAPTEPLTNVTNTKLLCCNSSTSATASTVTPGTITANGNASATRNELTGSIVLAVPGVNTQSTGSELVTNGTFDTNVSGWTITDTGTIVRQSDGTAKVTRGSSAEVVYQDITTVVNTTYELSVDITDIAGSHGQVYVKSTPHSGSINTNIGYSFYTGTYKGTFTADTTTTRIILYAHPSGSTSYDNVSVKATTIPDYSADIKGSGTNKTLTVNGESGIRNNDTSGSAVNGYYGSALHFDGTGGGDYIDTGYSIDGTFGSGDYTIECWIHSLDDQGERGIFGMLGSQYGISLRQFGSYAAGGNLTLQAHFGQSAAGYRTGTTVRIQDQWNHVAMVKEGTIGTLYLNGVAVGIANNVSSTPYSTSNLVLGIYHSGSYPFRGYIQDFRVYTTAKYKGGFDVPKPYAPVGIESWRQVSDTCKNNFATLNPLSYQTTGTYGSSVPVLTNGNLTYTHGQTGQWERSNSTMGVGEGKWYFEFEVVTRPVTGNTENWAVGLRESDSSSFYGETDAFEDLGDHVYWIDAGTAKIVSNQDRSAGSTSGISAVANGDIINIAFEKTATALKVWFGKNGTYFNSGNPATGSNPAVNHSTTSTFIIPAVAYYQYSGQEEPVATFNFGQNPAFSGTKIAGTNADSNGKGLFKYAPPSGFLALCEDNLPTPAIADPGEHFKTVLYTGTGSSRAVTGVGFKPDFIWCKSRTNTEGHIIFDSVRGPEKRILAMGTQTEATSTGGVMSFDDDGYSTAQYTGTNQSGQDYVAWCWKAGGAAVTNNDGQLTTQISANQTAGFSIVTWLSNAVGSIQTLGHGLGKSPDFIIVKNRDYAYDWFVWHKDLANTTRGYLKLNTSNNEITGGNDTWSVSSTTFGLRQSSMANANTDDFVAYCWAEIEGYSKFGSYLGNGNADGPFVYCGFKPAWVLIKKTDGSGTENWRLFDSSRCPTNQNNIHLLPSSANAESTETGMDFLSNGFKLRHADAHQNQNGTTYIFAAFAESPFQTANAK